MPLKDIAIGYSNGNTATSVLTYTLALAKQFHAQVTATHVHIPIAEESQIVTWMPDNLMEKLRSANREALKNAKFSFDKVVIETGYKQPVGWSMEEGDVNDVLATFARYFDLLIIGKYAQLDEERGLRVRAENIVNRSGRPILVVPPGYEVAKKAVSKIVIAWDGGYPASRALFDAVQLFGGIGEIDVISVVDDESKGTPARDISRYLAAHDINVKMNIVRTNKTSAAVNIIKYCEAQSADLLVVGNRGHARLRDGIFGGGTGHSLMEQSPIPVFISH